MPSTTTDMTWNAREDAYFGELDDGRTVAVSGAEIIESLHDAARADGVDLDALFESDRAAYNAAYDKYRDMQLDAKEWASLEGENDSVRVFCARCGDVSSVPESVELGGTNTGVIYCQCPCHNDGVALGKAQ